MARSRTDRQTRAPRPATRIVGADAGLTAVAPAAHAEHPDVDRFFDGRPAALDVFRRVRTTLEAAGELSIRVSRSQVAFRRRHGFAYLWLPGRYLSRPAAEVVLTVVLGRRDPSPRWKEVVHPARTHWVHHLELHDPAEIDDEVVAWLREAAERAG
jgi:hypothetical protein